MEEIITTILKEANNAPSGHNYQPWKFRIQNSALLIYNLPERDTTIYNFLQRGSLVSHGALIENIQIAASQHGYATTVRLFPEGKMGDCVARVEFRHSPEISQDNLFNAICKRTTNRKPYKNIPLQEAHRKRILEAGNQNGNTTRLRLIEDPAQKKLLADAFSANERLIMENRAVHQSLFPHIIWTEQEELARRSGLYVKTFELPPPARVAFRLFSHWGLVNIVGKRGLSKSVASQNAKIYASSSAMGLIDMQDNSRESFVNAGRTLERVWLTATALQISFQPVTAVLYLRQRIASGDTKQFSMDHINLVQQAYDTIQNVFGASSRVMAITFRIGYGGTPSAYSSKLPPHIEI
ncbi:MAG: hypothetical protein HY482_02690 [Candidatus Wildermuthbacteria bacterium]|nr:hypothetical protein [Candidatus Wildermuthbacteria bacterium]